MSFYTSKTLLVYRISGNRDTQLQVSYLESITAKAEPIECLLHRQCLWVLTDEGLEVYKFDDRFVTHDALSYSISRLNTSWQSLKNTVGNRNLFPPLYKRKYDNVQEYQRRKTIRLARNAE